MKNIKTYEQYTELNEDGCIEVVQEVMEWAQLLHQPLVLFQVL